MHAPSRKTLCTLLIAWASTLSTGPSARASILQNGTFEGGLAPWTLSSFDPNAVFQYATNFGHSPASSVMFGDANAFIRLAQPAVIAAGQEYQLSFWVYNLGVGNDQLIGSYSDGQTDWSVGLGMDQMVGTELESWVEVTVNFTAQINATSFKFEGRDGSAAFYIDDVTLTAVPTPGAGAATLLAFGMWCARRRRAAS